MEQKTFLYIDQNILQYDFENQLKLPSFQNIEWIYSDEHFNEINRQENIQLFEVIERIRARKIKIKLNEKLEITDEASIFDYDDPEKMYNEYLSTIDKYKNSTSQFIKFLPFFFGNKELDPTQFTENIKNIINILPKNLPQNINNDIKKLEDNINIFSEQMNNILLFAKSQIKPLDKQRKYLSNKQFSNFGEKDGPIIDQIWNEIKDKLSPITKDQFFGKELLPFYQPDKINRNQLIFLGIVQCHTALNYLGYWPDEGLQKISKIYGISSDASHIAHSYFCTGIMSADNRLCKKTRAIYEYFGKLKNVYQVKFC